MKVSLVAGLHGNEQLPVKALMDLKVDFILGNPQAYEKNIRFVEEDLNSSFGRVGDSHEIRRAKEILNLIPIENQVIDFHTTTAKTEPFVIIVDEKMLPFAKSLGVNKIVLMKHNIKSGNALINHRDGVSVELGNHHDRTAGYELVKTIVHNLNETIQREHELYEVYESISEKGEYENFKLYKKKFVPILAGEVSYLTKNIYGLKAKSVSSF